MSNDLDDYPTPLLESHEPPRTTAKFRTWPAMKPRLNQDVIALEAGVVVRPDKWNTGWRATVLRIEDGKALLDITELWLHDDLWRRLTPPVRAWVPVEGLLPEAAKP